MSDDLPSGSSLVCPRCGTGAGTDAYCSRCGLDLAGLDELPTADAYSARVREQRWLEQQERVPEPRAGSETDRAHGHHPAGAGKPQTSLRLVAAVLGAVLIAATVVVFVFGGSSDSDEASTPAKGGDASAASETAFAAVVSFAIPEFPEASKDDGGCSQSEDDANKYDCTGTWTTGSDTQPQIIDYVVTRDAESGRFQVEEIKRYDPIG